MRLLGLDPGLRHTGWGIIEAEGNRLRHVADGVIDVPTGDDMAERLAHLFAAVVDVVARFEPAEAAVEETFLNKNPGTTLKLGQARGVVLAAPATKGVPVSEYSTKLVKKSIVGTGRAEKAQVAMMVRTLLPGCMAEREDATDALAVAVCHAHHRSFRALAAGGAR